MHKVDVDLFILVNILCIFYLGQLPIMIKIGLVNKSIIELYRN